MTIRPYENKDKENVRYVHLNSDGPCKSTKRGINFGLAVYCDYYIEKEPENCFVLADENDVAVGYVLCAKEQKKYRRIFLKEYQPRVHGSREDKTVSWGEAWVHGIYARRYPAHLHIDILQGYRGGGNGTRMIAELLDHLKAQNVKGVHLVVGEDNPNAIRFYTRCGFKTLLKFGRGRIMGCKLSA